MADDIEVDYAYLDEFQRKSQEAVETWNDTRQATVGPMVTFMAGLPMVAGGAGLTRLRDGLTSGNERWMTVHRNYAAQLGVMGLDMTAVQMHYRNVDAEAQLDTANAEVLKASDGIDNDAIRAWNAETVEWNRQTTAENDRVAQEDGVLEKNRGTVTRNEQIVDANVQIAADNEATEESNTQIDEENDEIMSD